MLNVDYLSGLGDFYFLFLNFNYSVKLDLMCSGGLYVTSENNHGMLPHAAVSGSAFAPVNQLSLFCHIQ